jgi:hypothetical protein
MVILFRFTALSQAKSPGDHARRQAPLQFLCLWEPSITQTDLAGGNQPDHVNTVVYGREISDEDGSNEQQKIQDEILVLVNEQVVCR